MGGKKSISEKKSTINRSNVPSRTGSMNNYPASLLSRLSHKSTDELIIPTEFNTMTVDPETEITRESITFVCLDLPFESNVILFDLLQSLNVNIENFTDSSLCLKWIQFSSDSIFFISSSIDKDLLTSVHMCTTVESIFILNSKSEVSKNDFPKLAGVFNQHEVLLMVLKDMLNLFDQRKFEMFAFEDNKIFLWSQLWKEERMNTKVISNKDELAHMAIKSYRDNTKMLKLVETFRQSYRSNDVLGWCFSSYFPAYSLKHALHSHNSDQLRFYSFLLNDVSHHLKKQSKRNSSIEFYRGMKLPTKIVDKFEENKGKLTCANGFFICTKSRTDALALASSSSQRSDLSSVLFKIDCDPSISFTELSTNGKSEEILFDVYTTFKIICVNRGQMTVIKMKIANQEGKQMATEYKKKHNKKNIQILLDELLLSPKSMTQLTSSVKTTSIEISSSKISQDEIQAQEHLACGEIDLALAAYRRIQPVSPRILNLIGQIYTENLNNTDSALVCHIQALKMQGEKGEDTSDTLTSLAIVYHKCQKFDLAVSYHTQALMLREANHPSNSLLIANNLRGIANAHWALHQLPQALESAQRALSIYQSLIRINEKDVATTLSILANIYHDYDDDVKAVELGTQALALFERCVPTDSLRLAISFHNLAAFQLDLGQLEAARNNYEKSLNICNNILPPEHPKRISLENQIQCIIQMQKTSTGRTTNNIEE